MAGKLHLDEQVKNSTGLMKTIRKSGQNSTQASTQSLKVPKNHSTGLFTRPMCSPPPLIGGESHLHLSTSFQCSNSCGSLDPRRKRKCGGEENGGYCPPSILSSPPLSFTLFHSVPSSLSKPGSSQRKSSGWQTTSQWQIAQCAISGARRSLVSPAKRSDHLN